VQAMFARAIDAFGSVDILVNNAVCSAMRRCTR
jgi:NAD(P)-dependent dehydrogenase (short-subunit alcohol dehydrogenase family)